MKTKPDEVLSEEDVLEIKRWLAEHYVAGDPLPYDEFESLFITVAWLRKQLVESQAELTDRVARQAGLVRGHNHAIDEIVVLNEQRDKLANQLGDCRREVEELKDLLRRRPKPFSQDPREVTPEVRYREYRDWSDEVAAELGEK
jgi:erythromycin esterase-like protein